MKIFESTTQRRKTMINLSRSPPSKPHKSRWFSTGENFWADSDARETHRGSRPATRALLQPHCFPLTRRLHSESHGAGVGGDKAPLRMWGCLWKVTPIKPEARMAPPWGSPLQRRIPLFPSTTEPHVTHWAFRIRILKTVQCTATFDHC